MQTLPSTLSGSARHVLQKVSHQAGRVFQCAVLKVDITLRQGGILVRQQLLHMGKRHAIGNGHTGKGMPQSVQGTEIRRKIGGFFNGVDLLVDVSHAAHAVPAGKDIGAAVAADFGQQFAHRLGERDALVPAALGSFLFLAFDGDETALKVKSSPRRMPV